MKRWLFRSTAVAGGILMVGIPVTLFRILWAMEDNRRVGAITCLAAYSVFELRVEACACARARAERDRGN